MDIQTMREGNRRARPNVLGDLVTINVGLEFVRGQHHDEITPGCRVGDVHDLEPSGLSLGAARGIRAKRDRHIGDAAVLQVGSVGVALASVADDNDFLFLDQADIGITIVIDSHGLVSPS